MAFYDHATSFANKTVTLWEEGNPPLNLATTIPRIALDDVEVGNLTDVLHALLAAHDCAALTGIVIGAWTEVWEPDDSYSKEIVEALVKYSDRLSHITALFWGDITAEESEVSWIGNTNLSPLWKAFPKLEYLRIRGGNNLSLGVLTLPYLKELVIETGGMPRNIPQEIGRATLPSLEHLELYIGTRNYGGNCSLEDITALFANDTLANLRYVGLKNSDIQDDIAKAIVNLPIIQRIKVLDFSLGTLTDEGANALLTSENIQALDNVIINYHFCSDAMVEQLRALGNVAISDQQSTTFTLQNGEAYSAVYVAIGE